MIIEHLQISLTTNTNCTSIIESIKMYYGCSNLYSDYKFPEISNDITRKPNMAFDRAVKALQSSSDRFFNFFFFF